MATLGVVFPGAMVVCPFAATPVGWIRCSGQLINAADQPALFAAIGNAFNIGGESSGQFRVPDLRGRVPAGVDEGAGRISGYVPDALGGVGGQQNENAGVNVSGTASIVVGGTLSVGTTSYAMDGPDNTTPVTGGGGGAGGASHRHGNVLSSGTASGNLSGNNGINLSGATNVVSNVQPTIELYWVIKT
jgi:microcystin-dependent protein